MKVFYDDQIFSEQDYGGVSRYFYELISSLRESENFDVELLLKYSNNHYLNGASLLNCFTFLSSVDFRAKTRIIKFLNKQYVINKLKSRSYDIFHPTYYNPYFLNFIQNKPFVLTIYDMISEKYPELFSKNDKTCKNKRLLAQRAKKIITISENSKKDIIEYYGIEDSKVNVIYLASSIRPALNGSSSHRVEMALPGKYLLFVGKREGHKNFMGFLRAVGPLLRNEKVLYIVCAGGRQFSEGERKIFNEMGIADRVLHYPIDSDKTIEVFYQKAIALIYPSLYEGFGIPILEAFACRCPAVVSNSSSIPEVAGNAALYFDALKQESIKNAVAEVFYNSSLREDLTMRGSEQLKKFSWEKTAKETENLYLNIL